MPSRPMMRVTSAAELPFLARGYRFGAHKSAHGSRDPGAGRQLHALIEQYSLQRVQEQEHIPTLARISHQANAPDLGLQFAQSTGDFDTKFVEPAAAHLRSLYAVGYVDGSVGRWEER